MRRLFFSGTAVLLVSISVAWATTRVPTSMIAERPCQDGWLGCMVEGEAQSADPVRDTEGRLMPSSLRIGFFDLKALPSFSVHSGLSSYGAEEVPQVAAFQEPDPVEEPTMDEPALAQAEIQAEEEWEDPLFSSSGSSGSASSSAGSSSSSFSASPSQPRPSDSLARVVEPVEDRRPTTTTRPPPEEPSSRPVAVQEPVAEAVEAAPANCEDLRQLEGTALLGALSPAHMACLESRIGSERSQTTKNKISRVLLINAEASDNGEWPRLMRRHLEDIDRSDPDMCFKYALHLSKNRGVSSAYGVIRWSESALERKSRWSGPTYTRRVYDLHKLRSHAANRLWQRANEDLLNAGTNREELAGKEEKARATAKSLAREWLDFARATSQNTSEAMALCVSTAGSKKFCKE